MVRGAGAIAWGLGVPPVAVGLTVVAFGTSAPEFVVAVTGAATGAGGIAFGNLVGTNIINMPLRSVENQYHYQKQRVKN